MPMRSVPIHDADGNVIGRACYRAERPRCSTTGCAGHGTILCDFPVTRRGRQTTCSRRVCRGCAVTIGKGLDFCPPHARSAADSLVTICSACLTSSCAAGELPCEKRGSMRIVSIAQWKALLSFGAVR